MTIHAVIVQLVADLFSLIIVGNSFVKKLKHMSGYAYSKYLAQEMVTDCFRKSG
ncbi:MAG: hypothetical protein Q8R90_04050 [Bacteroidales bacterium]|nr:hypothetical protein [Bacteroidales bacterium]